MDGAGTGGRDAQRARVLGVTAGGEGRRFLVLQLDELDLVPALAEGLDDPVDPVTGGYQRRA